MLQDRIARDDEARYVTCAVRRSGAEIKALYRDGRTTRYLACSDFPDANEVIIISGTAFISIRSGSDGPRVNGRPHSHGPLCAARVAVQEIGS